MTVYSDVQLDSDKDRGTGFFEYFAAAIFVGLALWSLSAWFIML
jgi:hypothetical protein